MSSFVKAFRIDKSSDQLKFLTFENAGIVVALLIGCFLGSLAAGKIGDTLSRKKSICLSSLIFIAGVILQVTCVIYEMLLFTRFVIGLAVGAISVLVPVYQSEIAPNKDRGRLVSFQQLAITIGIASSFWITYACDPNRLSDEVSWRIPLVVPIIPALCLCTAGFFFLPSSPRWLLSRGHEHESEALDVLLKIRSGAPSDIQEELNGIKRELVLESEKQVQSCSILKDPSLVRRFILGMGIQIFSQLTGINSIMYYAPEIFKQTGFDKETIPLLGGISGCINVLFTIPAIYFIDKLGRRLSLIVGTIIMAFSMLTVGVVMKVYGYKEVNATTQEARIVIENNGASYAILSFIYIFVAAFAFSLGPIQWIYCAEIFPLTKRATGASLTTAAHWAANCLVSFSVPRLLENVWYGTYILFSALCTTIGVLVFLFYPETNGIPLERMDELFRGRKLVCSHSNNEMLNRDDFGNREINTII